METLSFFQIRASSNRARSFFSAAAYASLPSKVATEGSVLASTGRSPELPFWGHPDRAALLIVDPGNVGRGDSTWWTILSIKKRCTDRAFRTKRSGGRFDISIRI